MDSLNQQGAQLTPYYQKPVEFDRLTPLIQGFNEDSKMKTKLSEYVKVAEAAEILGVSQGTIRTWAEAGKIPMHKNPANGYRLFKRLDLETFLHNVSKPVNKPHSK